MGDVKMRIRFIDAGVIRETHDIALNLNPNHFLASLDAAILFIRQQGGLQWLNRRGSVTLPHERTDNQPVDTDSIGELRQDMEIGVWGRAAPPIHVARERSNLVRRNLGKHRYRYRPY